MTVKVRAQSLSLEISKTGDCIMKIWFITGASRGFGLRIARVALAQGMPSSLRAAAPMRSHLQEI
ncbi:hypothetical protein [Paraburkholderia youngii]|uniref:hypothetical protein n=1 Tax=Paraburkholderia youngii TaxID=2782701 RepID=UPI003D1D3525